jgi:hypothetical protein
LCRESCFCKNQDEDDEKRHFVPDETNLVKSTHFLCKTDNKEEKRTFLQTHLARKDNPMKNETFFFKAAK